MQREEQERANAHQDRMDARSAKHPLERMSIKQRGEMKLEEMRLEKKEEERRTNEEFLSRLEDDKDKERNIANIRRAEIAKSSEFNLNLIGRKKEQRLQDRLEASTSRQNMMIESEIHQAADTARSEMKRQLMRDVKSTLDQQVREFESRKINKEALSGNEISINKVTYSAISATIYILKMELPLTCIIFVICWYLLCRSLAFSLFCINWRYL